MDPPHDPPQSTPLLPPSTTKSSLKLLLTLFAITTLTLGITLAASLSTQSLPPITSATVSQGTNDPASFSIILVTGEETDKFTGLVIKDVECEIMRATGGADDGTKQETHLATLTSPSLAVGTAATGSPTALRVDDWNYTTLTTLGADFAAMYSYAKVSNAMNSTGVSPDPLLTAPSPINFTTTCTAQVGLTTFLSPTTPLATMSYETTTAVAIDHTHPMFTEHADWRTVNSYLQDTQDLLTSLSGGTLPVSLPVSKTFLPDTLTSLTVTLPPTTYTLATPGTAPSSVTVSGIDHDLLTTYTLPLAVTITTPPSTTATLTSRIAAALSNGDGVAITVASDDDTFLTAAAGNVHDVVLTESMYADGTGIGRVKEMTVVVDGGMPVVVGTDHDKGLVTVGCGGETLTIGARSQPRARALSIYNDDDVEEEEFIQGWLDYDPNYDNDEGDVLEQLEDLANDLEDLIPGEHSTWSDLKYFVEQLFGVDLDDVMDDLSTLDIDIDLRKGWNAAGGDSAIGDFFEVHVRTTNDGDDYSLTVSDDYDDWEFITAFVYNRGENLMGDAVVTDGGEKKFKADFDFLDGDYLPDATVNLKIGNPDNTDSGTSWCVALDLASTRGDAAVNWAVDVSYITSFGDNTESVATAELARSDAGSHVVTTGSVDIALVDKDFQDFGYDYLDRHIEARNFTASLEFEAKKLEGEYSLNIADFKILGGSFDYLHNHDFAVTFDPHFKFSTEGEIGIMDEMNFSILMDVSIPSSFTEDFSALTTLDASYCTIYNNDDEPRRVCDESNDDMARSTLVLALNRDNNKVEGDFDIVVGDFDARLSFDSDFTNHDGDGFEFELDISELKLNTEDFYYLHHHTVEASMEESWKDGFVFKTAGDIEVDGDLVIDAAFETGLKQEASGLYNRKFYVLATDEEESDTVAELNLRYIETCAEGCLFQFSVDGYLDGESASASMEMSYLAGDNWAFTLENTGGVEVNHEAKDAVDGMSVALSRRLDDYAIGPGGWMTMYLGESQPMATIRVEDGSITGLAVGDAEGWSAVEYAVPMDLSVPADVTLVNARFATAIMVDDAWKAADVSSIDATTTSGEIVRVWNGGNGGHDSKLSFKLLPLKETLGEKIESLAFTFKGGDSSSMHVKLFGFEEMSDEAMIGFRLSGQDSLGVEDDNAKLANWKVGLEVSTKCWGMNEGESNGMFGSLPMVKMAGNIPMLQDRRYYDKSSMIMPNSMFEVSLLADGATCAAAAGGAECGISMQMWDDYGDTWNGGSVHIKKVGDNWGSDGQIDLSIEDDGVESMSTCLDLACGSCYKVKTKGGEYPEEVSWAIYTPGGIIVQGWGESGTKRICFMCDEEEQEFEEKGPVDFGALYQEPVVVKAQMSMVGVMGDCDVTKMKLWVEGEDDFDDSEENAVVEMEMWGCDDYSMEGTDVFIDGDEVATLGEGVYMVVPPMFKMMTGVDSMFQLTNELSVVSEGWDHSSSDANEANNDACLDEDSELLCEEKQSCFGMSCDEVIGAFGSDREGLHVHWLENEAGCNCRGCQVAETKYQECSPVSYVEEVEETEEEDVVEEVVPVDTVSVDITMGFSLPDAVDLSDEASKAALMIVLGQSIAEAAGVCSHCVVVNDVSAAQGRRLALSVSVDFTITTEVAAGASGAGVVEGLETMLEEKQADGSLADAIVKEAQKDATLALIIVEGSVAVESIVVDEESIRVETTVVGEEEEEEEEEEEAAEAEADGDDDSIIFDGAGQGKYGSMGVATALALAAAVGFSML